MSDTDCVELIEFGTLFRYLSAVHLIVFVVPPRGDGRGVGAGREGVGAVSWCESSMVCVGVDSVGEHCVWSLVWRTEYFPLSEAVSNFLLHLLSDFLM